MTDKSIYVVSDTSVTGHPGCVRVTSELRRNLHRRGLRLVGSWPVGLDLRLAPMLNPAIERASAFVVNGEGTIHHTASRPRARQLAGFARVRKALADRPVFLVNASIEDIEPQDFADLRHYDRIYVRDRQSQRYLAEHGVASDYVPDLSLLTAESKLPHGDKMLITDSVLPAVTSVLEACCARLGADYLPMRTRKARSYWRYMSQKRSRQLARSHRYFEKIAQAGSVITGRFHAMLFCIVAGTPFLAVPSNTGKIEAALADIFDSADRVMAHGALEADAGLDIPPFSTVEEEGRRAYLAFARERAAAMFDQIVEAVSEAPARI